MIENQSFTAKQLRILQNIAEDEVEKMKGAHYWRMLDTVVYILVVVMIALSIRCLIFEPIRVEGDSMHPTLLHKEHMIVEKVSYWFNKPERGNIVICYYPGYKESCVKRVIGLPGETVSVKNGTVFINGAALDESDYWNDFIEDDFEPVTVPENHYFVMGDNRNASKDSRSASVGSIPMEKIIGRVRGVMLPVKNFRLIHGVDYS